MNFVSKSNFKLCCKSGSCLPDELQIKEVKVEESKIAEFKIEELNIEVLKTDCKI